MVMDKACRSGLLGVLVVGLVACGLLFSWGHPSRHAGAQDPTREDLRANDTNGSSPAEPPRTGPLQEAPAVAPPPVVPEPVPPLPQAPEPGPAIPSLPPPSSPPPHSSVVAPVPAPPQARSIADLLHDL